MKREAFSHPKLKLAARDLGISLCHMRGIIESLWIVTAVSFPRGDIGRWSNEEIEVAIDAGVDPGSLVETLVRRGLLDEHPEHRLVVHDWPEHADTYVHAQLAKRGLYFATGEEPRIPHEAFDASQRARIKAEYARKRGEPSRGAPAVLPEDSRSAPGGSGEDSPPMPVPVPLDSVVTTYPSDTSVGAAGADDDPDEGGVKAAVRAAERAGLFCRRSSKPPAARESRGTRIPEDFALTPMRRERARVLGLPADMVQDTFDEFVAYWTSLPGKGARKLNWDLTWDNRCRQVVQALRARGGPGRPLGRTAENLTAAEKTQASMRRGWDDERAGTRPESLADEFFGKPEDRQHAGGRVRRAVVDGRAPGELPGGDRRLAVRAGQDRDDDVDPPAVPAPDASGHPPPR